MVRADFGRDLKLVCYLASGCMFFDFVTDWHDLPWLIQVIRVAIGLWVCRVMFPLGWRALKLYPTWPRPWSGIAVGVLIGTYAFMLTLGAPL